MQNLDELFDVVDAADRVIGRAARRQVHARRLRHRAVHIFVFDPRGWLFVQKRAAKDAKPVHAAAVLLGALFADVMSRDMMPEALPSAKQAPAVYAGFVLRAIGYTARHTAAHRRPSAPRNRRSA